MPTCLSVHWTKKDTSVAVEKFVMSFCTMLHSTPDSLWALSVLMTDCQAVKAESVLSHKLGSLARCQRGKLVTAPDVVVLFSHNTRVPRPDRLRFYGHRRLWVYDTFAQSGSCHEHTPRLGVRRTDLDPGRRLMASLVHVHAAGCDVTTKPLVEIDESGACDVALGDVLTPLPRQTAGELSRHSCDVGCCGEVGIISEALQDADSGVQVA